VKTTGFTIGLVVAAVLGLADFTTGALDAPPLAAVIISAVLGAITLVGVVMAWRGSRPGLWAVIVTRVLSALSGVPGLFVDDTSGAVKAFIAAGLIVTALAVALLAPGLRREPAHPAV
jgi:tellurite resistance protein TehA-like permease